MPKEFHRRHTENLNAGNALKGFKYEKWSYMENYQRKTIVMVRGVETDKLPALARTMHDKKRLISVSRFLLLLYRDCTDRCAV